MARNGQYKTRCFRGRSERSTESGRSVAASQWQEKGLLRCDEPFRFMGAVESNCSPLLL